jgi:hypothetical protein
MAKKEVPKFGAKETIQFVGMKDLTPEEQDVVQSLSTEYFEKIKREIQNNTDLTVHIKTDGVSATHNKRKRYTLMIRAVFPGFVIESKDSDDYELPKALHQSFEEIISQIHHRLRTDSTRPKPYE